MLSLRTCNSASIRLLVGFSFGAQRLLQNAQIFADTLLKVTSVTQQVLLLHPSILMASARNENTGWVKSLGKTLSHSLAIQIKLHYVKLKLWLE